MWFKMLNEDFICENCSKQVHKDKNWWVRNHCPFCLHCKHLDDKFPWDRASECWWLMVPVDIDYKKNKWYMIKHKCIKCNKEILNSVSDDDNFMEFIEMRNKAILMGR